MLVSCSVGQHTCFTYNTIPIYLPTYFSLGTFHQDLTPIDLHEVRLEVCIQNSKTFICTQHTGTRESPKLSCARSTPALASHKTQKLFIRTQHTGTRESLHEKMAGNPKTSEARREESRNRPNPYFSQTTNWSKSLSFHYRYSSSWSGTRVIFGSFEPN